MAARDERPQGAESAGRRVSEEALLETIRELVDELDGPLPSAESRRRLGMDSSLGGELGLDSLARAELVGRLEARFAVTLPDEVLAEAERPRDLLRALEAAPSSASGATSSTATPSTATGAHGAAPATEPTPDPAPDPGANPRAPGAPRAIDPRSAATLIEAADLYAAAAPERRHVLLLDSGPGEGAEHELTYGALQRRSRRVAAALQGMGLEPGQRVGVMLPTCLEYFSTFLGIQRAGGVPVPMYPPVRASQVEDHLRRQAAIMTSAGVRILVTFDQVRRLAALAAATVASLDRVVTAEALDGEAARSAGLTGWTDWTGWTGWTGPPVTAGSTAFLQYTSGSTGNPKGVVLSHANLLANLRSMTEVLAVGGDDVIVSWLPLYHDMGLIGAWMGSLYYGVPLVLMSPLSFLSRPGRWLRAIDRYRGTLSAAPNFAYELCLEKLSDDELAGLDLSSWRLALNGAEPVSPRAVERFPERFARYGFSPGAMMPVYGLAESSLAVSFTPPGRGAAIDAVDRRSFQRPRPGRARRRGRPPARSGSSLAGVRSLTTRCASSTTPAGRCRSAARAASSSEDRRRPSATSRRRRRPAGWCVRTAGATPATWATWPTARSSSPAGPRT